MSKKLISLLLVLSMCITCVVLALAEEDDQDVSLADYFAKREGTGIQACEDSAPKETELPVDKALPAYELDGSIVLTMSFTGDVTIGSNMQSSSKSIFEKELDKQKGDVNYPFRNVRDIFQTDDLTLVNFEGTLTTAGKNRNKLDNDFLFRAPPEYVSMLPEGFVEAVALENNHVLDMGEDGLVETKQILTNAGIAYSSEGEPAIMTVRGVKIGMLAYQTFGGRHQEIAEKLPEEISALRQQGCEVVIVSYHWGDEKDYAPNDNQVMLGRASVDAGADLVVGHHSHRINPVELYKGKYICYSLGNFSFAGHNKPDDMSTFIFQVKMRVKDGVVTNDAFRIIPCRISSRTDYNDFTPTPYDKQQNVESLLSVLKKNGSKLEYAVEEYPTKWPGEE